jgi:MFS family permease
MVLGGAGMASTGNFYLLTIAATIGVISPTGAEVGPFLAIEQACVAHVIAAKERTRAFAWYHVAGFTMSALGALGGGLLANSLQAHGWSAVASYRLLFWIFAGCGIALFFLSARLDASVEAQPTPAETTSLEEPLMHRLLGLGESRPTVMKLSVLFALDSFGGGFCVQSFIAWWCHQKFGVSDADLGGLFFGANLLSGFSALAAVPLAKRIGLINTMVWTHLPSSILLMCVPLMPTFAWAAVFLWLRNCISQMDVPTRTSYVNAIVPAQHRSAANGVTTTAKQLGTSLAPLIAAPLIASAAWMSAPFFLCGGSKIIYDLLLWRNFRKVRPPEEHSTASSPLR